MLIVRVKKKYHYRLLNIYELRCKFSFLYA